MQELFFGLVGWDRTVCALYVFIFVTQNSITLKKTKGLQKDRKKILIYLNSHRYCVIYYLYCLNTSVLKWNASLPYLLLSPLQMLFDLVTQCPLFPIWERVCCVTRPHNSCKRDYTYCHNTPVERKSKLFVYSYISYLKNMILHNFTTKGKLKLCCSSNRP